MYNEFMPSFTPTIISIGARANQLLEQSPSASIWGSTSKGIFLHLPPQGLIFISFEPYHGPLTANLSGDLACLRRVTRLERVQIEGERLVFPGSDIALGWREIAVWDVPPLPRASIKMEEVQKRYQEVNRLVTARCPPSINRSLLAKQPALSETKESNLVPDDLLQNLLPLLGQGAGLTPAGDDVILGCLLALSRWGQVFSTSLEIRELSQILIAQAFHRTTLLSANLIECAAAGQADERLICTLDGIITGHLSAEGCADLILGWGHSSGVDALRGMGVVIQLVR